MRHFIPGSAFYACVRKPERINEREPETEFKSVAYEARCLEDYIISNYGGRVDILYGLSYGCRTLMQVLEDNRLQITTTIADGMSLRDYGKLIRGS